MELPWTEEGWLLTDWRELSCELPIVLIRYYNYSKKIWKTKDKGLDHTK